MKRDISMQTEAYLTWSDPKYFGTNKGKAVSLDIGVRTHLALYEAV